MRAILPTVLSLLRAAVVLSMMAFAVRPVPASTWIVVNFEGHPSVEVAAHAEVQVNWLKASGHNPVICTESFAALELQHYLRAMTGSKHNFSIVNDRKVPEGELIIVGSPASNAVAAKMATALGVGGHEVAALGPEGYRIKTGDVQERRVTLIAGGGRVGTLYGVYDLLHRMGCRWFSPAPFDEEVPDADWNPAFDITQRPSFSARGFYVYQKRGSPEMIQWMARNRLNLWSVLMDNESLMHKLGMKLACGTHDAEWLFLNPESPYPYNHPRLSKPKLPKDPYPISELFQGDVNHNGILSYFEAHPEWYPMVGGRRAPGIVGKWSGTNFCTSNADAVTEFVQNYVQAVINGIYCGADAIELWMLDGGKWCECPKCKALGTPTDRNLLLVYRLDQEIKRAQREGRLKRPIAIRFLAYADVIEPPTRPLPADFDYKTCTATFFPICRCYVHQFDDPICPANAKYARELEGWITDPERYYRGAMCIGEYYNIRRFKCLPVCFMHEMAHDIPHYYQLGARQFHYMHVTTGHWGTKSLTNYQMARQLWDVNTDCEKLWADYFAQRYGPAAPVMRRFYESLEKMLCNVEAIRGYTAHFAPALNQGLKPLFAGSHLRYQPRPGETCDGPTLLEMVAHSEMCRALITQAMAMRAPERIKSRLAEDERTFTYAERTLHYYDQCVQAYELAWAGRKEEARQHFEEAKRVAKLLHKDTWSVALSFIHDDEPNQQNALDATYAAGALDHLAELLGPSKEKTPPKTP